MKLAHFTSLRPVCPRCVGEDREVPLELSETALGDAGDVLQGLLHCSGCYQEYPILDGIPILVPSVRSYVAQHYPHLLQRQDLTPLIESVIGDCCGPGSLVDSTRQHLNSYGTGHYGDLDPGRPEEEDTDSVVDMLDRGLDLAGEVPAGPTIDTGCAVGRATFALAERREGLVLGIDLSFSMLSVAARALREGVVRYPSRRVGLVYDRREFPVQFPGAERVDFWVCDAAALPFPRGTFALATSLNVLDCVPSPREHLLALRRALSPGGKAVITTPYDWSQNATPVEAWLGGHSQRAGSGGSSEAILRALLTEGGHPASIPGLTITAETEALPWRVRVHDRHTATYRVHLVVAQAS